MNNLTLEDLIESLVAIRDNTTAMRTTPTNILAVENLIENGIRKIVLTHDGLSLVERDLHETIRRLEDDVASLEDELRDYRYADGRREKDQ